MSMKNNKNAMAALAAIALLTSPVAIQNRTEQNRTEQNRTEQNRTEQRHAIEKPSEAGRNIRRNNVGAGAVRFAPKVKRSSFMGSGIRKKKSNTIHRSRMLKRKHARK